MSTPIDKITQEAARLKANLECKAEANEAAALRSPQCASWSNGVAAGLREAITEIDELRARLAVAQPDGAAADLGPKEDPIRVACAKLVREHSLAVEKLTEQQLAEALRQAITCGDFQRYVHADTQRVVYLPAHRLDDVERKYHELLFAVGQKHDSETRHETALRYIREREQVVSGPAQQAVHST